MIYFLCALFVLFWTLFIWKVAKNQRMDGFYLKGLTSLSFIFIYAYGAYKLILSRGLNYGILIFDYRYTFLIIFVGLGLVAGLIGDLFLEVQYFYPVFKERQITFGMSIFLLGHLFYLFGLAYFTEFNYFSLLIAFVITLLVIFGSKIMKFKMGKIEILSYIYTFVIFTMVGQTFLQMFSMNFSAFSILFMVGAVLFGVSDLILAPIYFKDEKSKVFVIGNLFTYYMAQVLIALSILFL